MVVKAAKNRYYHFSLNCGQILIKRRKSTRYSAFSAVFIFFRALSLFGVEHVLGKDEVAGSNPANSSTITTIYGGYFLYISTIYGVES